MCDHRNIQEAVWTRGRRIKKCRLFISILLFFFFAHGTGLTGVITYTVVDEKIHDSPAKAQIVQHIVVSGVPTKADLEDELWKRYRAAKKRSGFRFHNSATHIFIFVYGTKEQALAGWALWIGMINMIDEGEPHVYINEERLAALSRGPEERFGLSEQKRQLIFREMERWDDPGLARKYGLTTDQLREIMVEGIKKGWPLD